MNVVALSMLKEQGKNSPVATVKLNSQTPSFPDVSRTTFRTWCTPSWKYSPEVWDRSTSNSISALSNAVGSSQYTVDPNISPVYWMKSSGQLINHGATSSKGIWSKGKMRSFWCVRKFSKRSEVQNISKCHLPVLFEVETPIWQQELVIWVPQRNRQVTVSFWWVWFPKSKII